MQLVQSGDRQAYEVLFARYQGPVWRYLVRLTRDAEAAAELFQEAFLRVWTRGSTFRAGQAFRPWLFRIAANLARDRFRSTQRQVDTVEIDEERQGLRMHMPVASIDLERALGELPDAYREAFLLGVVEGMDHNEVAAALDISPDNARARISRARSRLRALLGESA